MPITPVPSSAVDPVAQVVAALEAATSDVVTAGASYAVPKGAWSSSTTYAVNTVVTYGGGTYRAVAANTNVTPGTDATKWESWGGGVFTDQGSWVTSTAYVVGDVVTQSGQRYVCRTAHTAGAFATDLAALKWVPLDVVSAAASSRQIISGTGLTGGGDLSADRTLTVSYGTTSGTAAQGNDSRITGALQKSSNLSDLPSVSTARTSLGAGSASGLATLDSSTLVPTAQLGTGSASSAKVLQGDRTWATAVTLAQSGQTPAQEPVASGTTGVGTLAYAARADHVHASVGLYGWLGDGADGAATFDGSATPTGVTKVSSVLYRANADLHYTSITGSSGVTLEMAGYLLHSRGTLAGPGSGSFTIAFIPGAVSGTNNGTAGGGGTNGRPATLGVGSTGGTGGTGAGASPSSPHNVDNIVNSANGVSGGAGSNGAGGSGSTGTQNVGISQGMRRFDIATTGMRVGYDGSNPGNSYPPVILGGFGAGSGGGDGTNVGGAGGRGGGVCIVNAYTVTGNVTVTANGGAGGSPTTGNCGGGGGGNGGWAQLNSTDLTGWTGSVTASGGTHGTASGSGVNGTDGTAGIARSVTWR